MMLATPSYWPLCVHDKALDALWVTTATGTVIETTRYVGGTPMTIQAAQPTFYLLLIQVRTINWATSLATLTTVMLHLLIRCRNYRVVAVVRLPINLGGELP